METTVINYLKEKYRPAALVLYGSRATGNASPTSDWDFLMLMNSNTEAETEIIDGQTVDLDVVILPSSEQELVEKFDGALQNTKIVFDPDGVAAKILEKVSSIYSNGRNLSPKELKSRLNFMTRRLQKLEVNIGNDSLFFFHLGVFFEKAIQYWFEIKENRWKMSPGPALKIIEGEDPGYIALLKVISSKLSNAEKLNAAKKITELYPV